MNMLHFDAVTSVRIRNYRMGQISFYLNHSLTACVLASQVNISSLSGCVLLRALFGLQLTPLHHHLPLSPSQGLLWLQVVRSLWEEMAQIVSWHFSVFFFFLHIAVNCLQKRKFVASVLYCCGIDGEILQVGINPLTAAFAHACFAIASKPVMHSYTS